MGDDGPGRRPHRRGPARRLTRRPRGRTYSRFVLTVIPFRAEGKSRLPEDLRREVALVGFDDFPLADLLDPGVTVVAQDPAAMGRAAARALFERMEGLTTEPREIRIPTTLIPRGSGEITG